jgi:peptidoglycan/LPS O-acetylase OafA/YrhL
VALVTLVVGVGVSAASYYLVEQPGAAWVKNFWLKRTISPAQVKEQL